MKYGDLPWLIPLFATAYIVTIYGLLKLAAGQSKTKRITPSNAESLKSEV
jgi:hypothetical protein